MIVKCINCGLEFAGVGQKLYCPNCDAMALPSAETGVDMVNHPPHYTSHPSGVECIQVTEHYGFCIGSAIKYLWRAGLKGDAVEDLKKAVWYINREISKREQSANFKSEISNLK